MAGIVTLSIKSTLATARDEYRYTAARLKRHKLTADTLFPEFMAFEAKLVHAETEQEELLMEEEECNAWAEFLDEELDVVVDKVTVVTGNTRGSAEFKEFYGSQQPYDFKRPTLEGQLESMASWELVLANKTDSRLVEVRHDLERLLPEAQMAQAQKRSVETRLRVFRETGTRAKLMEEFNALRKSVYGKLADLQHTHNLGAGWAESFFRQSSNKAMTLRQVERRIASTDAQLAHLKSVHAEMLKKEADEAEAARLAEERARQAAIAAKRAQIARLQEDLAALDGPPKK